MKRRDCFFDIDMIATVKSALKDYAQLLERLTELERKETMNATNYWALYEQLSAILDEEVQT